jgi:hypothetical protein
MKNPTSGGKTGTEAIKLFNCNKLGCFVVLKVFIILYIFVANSGPN